MSSNENFIEPIKLTFPENPFRYELVPKEYDEDVKHTTCPICLNLVWNPVHCSLCTNLICSTCISDWLKKSPNCPFCNGNFKGNPVVNLVKNALSKIKSKCHYSVFAGAKEGGNSEDVCNKLISYYDYDKHIKGECEYYPYKCTRGNCTVVGPKIKMLEHYKYCDYNLVSCIYCKLSMSKRLLESHEKLCDCRTIKCDRCECDIKEGQFTKHKENIKDCINTLKNSLKDFTLENETLKNKIVTYKEKEDITVDLRNEMIQLDNKTRLIEDKSGIIILVIISF